LLAARAQAAFTSVEDLALRADLNRRDLDALAAADALAPLAGHRRQQVWQASALRRAPGLLRQAPVDEAPWALPAMAEGEDIVFDYQALGLSLRRHPLALLRPRLDRDGLRTAAQLLRIPGGRAVAACGIVTVRQQPGTAKGVTFVSLEDESGTVNVIVGRALRERQREEVLHSRLLVVWGRWERNQDPGHPPGWGPVCNLVARRVADWSHLLGRLASASRDFH
jgi:error-prone DNA polymerase